MKSFRTEFESPFVEKDIIELERKIRLFKEGEIDEERFRSLRLARGVYGQRQQGVQMIRIKIPYGRLTSKKLYKIADVSDTYSTGRLHITTRQDIQIHYVSLDHTPQLWAELEKEEVTLREACGNTVRNVTASELAGIDTDEVFDVSPYADTLFRYFLRNPICQEMGRKFKIAFSGSEKDDALTFMHDLGFIAKVNEEDEHGFKVLLAGGLGSQPREADVVYEFLPAERIIPFTAAVLRIFDRHGERVRRLKARLKFLINEIGLEAFLAEVEKEEKALPDKVYPIDYKETTYVLSEAILPTNVTVDSFFSQWKKLNCIPQKQKGLFAVGLKIKLGDFYTNQARVLADLAAKYASGELRLTLRQNLIIPFVKEALLPLFYQELKALGLADIGFNSTTDITACPGTDTCNLGIASSTGIAAELERVLEEEYPHFVENKEVLIKISGCMNACGQHNMAHIGFQGMTIKVDKFTAPALQVLIGGGTLGGGKGRFSDKVIKIPSKRGPQALRLILDDFEREANGEDFLGYYDAKGSTYFYELLKPLTDTSNLQPEDFIDWGNEEVYKKEIGVGECAGVVIDLVSTLLYESEEKLTWSKEADLEGRFADAIYHAYNVFISAAKALLTATKAKINSQASIVSAFDEYFGSESSLYLGAPFSEIVYEMREQEPSASFAKAYIAKASDFQEKALTYHNSKLNENNN
ncbi:MAG: nitrite/sulfite reductase [Crocinitomicaceae bacterium]|nr:nitrite/sulfite reductase [Crocinitomicaceae bacterium]